MITRKVWSNIGLFLLYLVGTYLFVAACWLKVWGYGEYLRFYDFFLILIGFVHFSAHYLLLWSGLKKMWISKYNIIALALLDGFAYVPTILAMAPEVFFLIIGAPVEVYFFVLLVLCFGILFLRIYSSKKFFDHFRYKEENII